MHSLPYGYHQIWVVKTRPLARLVALNTRPLENFYGQSGPKLLSAVLFMDELLFRAVVRIVLMAFFFFVVF